MRGVGGRLLLLLYGDVTVVNTAHTSGKSLYHPKLQTDWLQKLSCSLTNRKVKVGSNLFHFAQCGGHAQNRSQRSQFGAVKRGGTIRKALRARGGTNRKAVPSWVKCWPRRALYIPIRGAKSKIAKSKISSSGSPRCNGLSNLSH